MPVRYEIDAAAGLVRLDLSGAVTPEEVFAYHADLAVDPALRPGLSVLVDSRQVTSAPSFAELHGMAITTVTTAPSYRPTRVAVLVSAGWLFGIVRQFDALVQGDGIRVVPFYDPAAACRWLAAADVPADRDRPVHDGQATPKADSSPPETRA